MPYRAACILKINDNIVDRIELSKSENAYEEGGNKQVNNKTQILRLFKMKVIQIYKKRINRYYKMKNLKAKN